METLGASSKFDNFERIIDQWIFIHHCIISFSIFTMKISCLNPYRKKNRRQNWIYCSKIWNQWNFYDYNVLIHAQLFLLTSCAESFIGFSFLRPNWWGWGAGKSILIWPNGSSCARVEPDFHMEIVKIGENLLRGAGWGVGARNK